MESEGTAGSDRPGVDSRILKSAQTRRRILDAAAKVFSERGYSATRLPHRRLDRDEGREPLLPLLLEGGAGREVLKLATEQAFRLPARRSRRFRRTRRRANGSALPSPPTSRPASRPPTTWPPASASSARCPTTSAVAITSATMAARRVLLRPLQRGRGHRRDPCRPRPRARPVPHDGRRQLGQRVAPVATGQDERDLGHADRHGVRRPVATIRCSGSIRCRRGPPHMTLPSPATCAWS